jgi:hypothetical protein
MHGDDKQQVFDEVFSRLKGILEPYRERLKVDHEREGDFSLSGGIHPRTQKPTFFGAAQIKKNYVSFHLMPVYIYPELLHDISAELKARMQGKSCFNFKRKDEALFDELTLLTERGYERFREDDLLPE